MAKAKEMTDARWRGSEKVDLMLRYLLRQKVSARKLRLFACACCRMAVELRSLPFPPSIELAERFADQQKRANWTKAYADAYEVISRAPRPRNWNTRWHPGLISVTDDSVLRNALPTEATLLTGKPAPARALIRCVFGNPFRPVTMQPDWLTDTVLSLAKQMYDSREFSAMPILADALQDAGCDNDDVLNHCRDTKTSHVRGCWVVDLVLGKT